MTLLCDGVFFFSRSFHLIQVHSFSAQYLCCCLSQWELFSGQKSDSYMTEHFYLSSHKCLLWLDALQEGTLTEKELFWRCRRTPFSSDVTSCLMLKSFHVHASLKWNNCNGTSTVKSSHCVPFLSFRNSSCRRTTIRWPQRAHTRVRQEVCVCESVGWCHTRTTIRTALFGIQNWNWVQVELLIWLFDI